MKRLLSLMLAIVAPTACGLAPGAEPLPGPASNPWRCNRSLLGGCPDDYCRKPCPPSWPLPCGGPDDYWRKPCPPAWPLPCGEPDDYCRKPCPNLCWPPCPPY